ncbi:curli assembly protein CsgF [Alcaligenes sp. WGS1538]|uniref:curli assembly protein CsgF n=1 Tax=Alcaligenes sp. WGS1538 TaxID=3366811 RepID=UPI00372D486C
MKTLLPLAPALLAGALLAPAQATELVYTPVNPSFGGSPLNGQWLLNSAQITNKHTDPDAQDLGSAFEQRTPFQDFNDQLERSVLSRLASAASSQFVDSNGKFVPGTFETGSFTVSVVDVGGGALTITTTDRITGASTTFRVMQP